ncbi:MAG: ParB N-terminal domain-containing protein [Anaerolineae bacterium]|nr:ParB N-terminal domain-containing protein [Anaerolineae bacterium]
MTRKREANTGMLASVTAEMLGGAEFEIVDDGGVRVERILLEMMRPDPAQPRRILPERVYQAFHNSRLTPTQALRELIQTAQIAARQNGRPFGNVLELLGNPEDERESEAQALSPEEVLVRDLVNLAMTIRDDGQVNPLTVVDVTQGVTRQYRIETGERRYWATWLLRDFIPGYESDGLIPCIVIPAEKSSPFRQARENIARAGLSAIAMARQAALLLLTVHGYEIPAYAVDNDFYRQALTVDLRGRREYTEVILAAMGGIDKSRFSQYKALLHLSDEALELADRHGIEERSLRYVLSLDPEHHGEVLRQIVSLNLTSKQVKQLCEEGLTADDGSDEEVDRPPAVALRMARLARGSMSASAQDIARAFLRQEEDLGLARARLQAFRNLLNEAEQYLVSDEKGLPG